MSLLHSQEYHLPAEQINLHRYVIHHLRTRYLKTYPDGVGDRIISINPNSLSGAAARAGGYFKPEDLRRSFSPPITTEATYLGANPRATTTIRGEVGWKGRIKRRETMPNMSHQAETDDDGSDDEFSVDPDLEYTVSCSTNTDLEMKPKRCYSPKYLFQGAILATRFMLHR